MESVTGIAGDYTKVYKENDSDYLKDMFDGDTTTKGGCPMDKGSSVSDTVSVVFETTEAVTVRYYTFATGNDRISRDPVSWVLSGSNDGSDWTVLDTRNDVEPPALGDPDASDISNDAESRCVYYDQDFEIATPAAYNHYKFEFSK